jgi:hypothetical protein
VSDGRVGAHARHCAANAVLTGTRNQEQITDAALSPALDDRRGESYVEDNSIVHSILLNRR